jgi:anti-sigma B factor antagonist
LLPLDKESKLKLDAQIRVVDQVTILYCKGRLTYREEARAFSETMAAVISDSSQIVIEMSGLEAIDSAGLGELAVIHMWARASGCTLKLAGPSSRLQQLFELTNLRSIFEIYSRLDEALCSFQKQILQAEAASSAA